MIDGETIVVSDEIVEVAGSIFVTSTATLYLAEGTSWSAKGHAMHPLTKKGMDPSQITGSASSYARKYALAGLIAIDDGTGDPDGAKEPYEKAPEKKRSWAQTITDELPDDSSPRDKAEAIATALCSQWTRMKSENQMGLEWDRRVDLTSKLETVHPDLHQKVVDAYELRLMDIKDNG